MSQRSFKTRKRKRQHASKQVRRERSKKAQASTRSKASTAARERITVCVKAPRPESEEASMNTAQKYQQTLRKLGAQMQQLVEEDEEFFVPGFTPSRVTVDKYGQVKHRLVKMSAYFQQILTMCENLVHNPAVLPGLAAYCPGMKRKDVRTYTAQVLAVLLCSSEFEGGRIGYLQVGAEMNPKSHRELMKEYLLRFGQEINEETWYAAYGRLKKAGYIQDMKVTLPIDLPREGQENLTLIRSAAAYKQFTPRFFEHFKVTRFENVKALIQAGIAKQKAQGYGFKWVSYSILAKGIRDRIQAQFLNELINDTSPVVGTHTSPDIPIPY